MKPFYFAEGQPKPLLDDNKENNAQQNEVLHKKLSQHPEDQIGSQPQPGSPSKPPPSTPATRLPLADLLGENEDARPYLLKTLASPQEQLGWRASKSPRSSNPKATPGTRGHKRAHSSTPPSASQRSAIKKAKHKAALDLEELKQSLRTPQTDPATDLWQKYNLGTSRDTLLGQHLASVANGLASSSPYTTEDQTGNVSGLRRWTSCGMEFPSAKRKRRKVETTAGTHRIAEIFGDAPPQEDAPTVDRAKSSRIGSLLERISESLERSKHVADEEHAPSSSSPLPDRHDEVDRLSISPLRAPELARSREQLGDEGVVQQHVQRHITTGDTSDYGSDSLGSETLHANSDTNAVEPAVEAAAAKDGMPPTFDEEDFDDDFDLSVDDFDVAAGACAPQVAEVAHPTLGDTCNPADGEEEDFGLDDLNDDDDDIDEELFAAAEATATQTHSTASRTKSSVKRRHRAIQRYLVKTVIDCEHVASNGRIQTQKVLSVQEEKTSALKTITLRESWFDTRCSEGSYVHVIGTFDKHGHCIINDAENMLILHPDHLISALTVADSFSCMRKAVLQDRIKATSESSPPMLYGTILHEIFQDAMKVNRWDEQWLNDCIVTIVDRHVEDLYQTNLTIDAARIHLQGKIPELQAWAKVFIKSKNEGFGTVKDRNGKNVQMSVNKLLDVEEHVWSPMYGLKGNIDATIQVTMETEDNNAHTLTVPLELKTGKRENPSHRAQTALYTLLLSDRYDVAVAYGILYYIETSQTLRIPAIRHELRHMIMQRNELACYVRERLDLPPMLRNTHTCTKCYAKDACFLYHKLVEDGDGETSGLRDKFDALTKQLGPVHQSFFQKWNDLLTKEESEMMKFRRELWTMLSHEREKLGRCFANVSLMEESASEDVGTSKINRYSYSFCKLAELANFSFSESQIAVGDPIVISDERGHYALAKGYVTNLTKTRIAVAVDRRLHNARTRLAGFDAENNQVFAGITDTYSKHGTQIALSQASNGNSTPSKPLLYRVDKDEFSNGMALVRANLTSLMSHTAFNATKLRSLIVEGAEPKFNTHSTAYDITGPASQSGVNPDQRHAIEKILSAEDYALVLGMPGTGKTTTIAHIIRALVAKGKSVLLASYTHSAVDNILLKLRDDKIPILRLGALAKIHPDVGSFASLAAESRATVEELERMYHDPQVVATTCLGVNHAIFQQRTFDYCIVDEASQITLPVCVGPIRLARSFVLVGDHFQLPPLVQNRDALAGGLDVSLFRSLCEDHPDAVVELGVQYRMNAEIMSLANTLIYNGKLKCGSEAVAQRRLTLPSWAKLVGTTTAPTTSPPNSWIHTALAPTSSPLIFLNTDTHPPHFHETAHGARVTNTLEATLTVTLVRLLITSGVPPGSIGIITLYRSQLALIKTQLATALGPLAKDVEAHTADRFQGRDKAVVIISSVRSNERKHVGELLKDWRRVNVAVTRARSKILVVGSRGTLGGDELLGRMIGLFEVGGRVVDVEGGWEGQVPETGALPAAASSVEQPANSGSPSKQGTQKPQSSEKAASPRKPLATLSSSAGNARPRAQGQGLKQPLKPTQKPFKVPAKVGKGGLDVRKGPVLDDVMREILGAENDF